MPNDKVKQIFQNLYDAHRWSLTHPAISFPNEYKLVCEKVDAWCDEFEAMGYDRRFALCIFTFGTDYRIAYDIYCNGEKTGGIAKLV